MECENHNNYIKMTLIENVLDCDTREKLSNIGIIIKKMSPFEKKWLLEFAMANECVKNARYGEEMIKILAK